MSDKTQCWLTSSHRRDLYEAGAFRNGTVKDVSGWQIRVRHLAHSGFQIVYTMPPAITLIPKLVEIKDQLHRQGAKLILMVDHPVQIDSLKGFAVAEPWLVYLKLDIGSR